MFNRSLRTPGRLALLLAALLLTTAAACSGAPANQAVPTAYSVQGQLGQLAASAQPNATRTLTSAVAKPTRTARATATPSDGLPTIAVVQLPREARDTIRLIRQGGPFPYDQDGATFGNREGRLPKRPSGYYQEYTVITPGSRDRGARRIIAGQGGELYYTDDHYDTFKQVVP